MNCCYTELWDAEHKRRLTIQPADDMPYFWVIEDAKQFGVECFTKHEGVAECFGTKTVNSQTIREEQEAAIDRGDFFFPMELGDHSAYAFRVCGEFPASSWDSGCCGILTVSRERWSQAAPDVPFERARVLETMRKLFNKTVEHLLNSSFWEIVIRDEDGSDTVEGLFFYEDEALEEAKKAFPEFKYEECDFDKVYQLR